MPYLLLLTHDPSAATDESPHPDDGIFDDWQTYTQALHEAGVLLDGAGLHGPSTATVVRVRRGERLLTDGPFAETKEGLIGYYVLDLPDLDAALAWAARAPNVRTGAVEVRPILAGSRVADRVGPQTGVRS